MRCFVDVSCFPRKELTESDRLVGMTTRTGPLTSHAGQFPSILGFLSEKTNVDDPWSGRVHCVMCIVTVTRGESAPTTLTTSPIAIVREQAIHSGSV